MKPKSLGMALLGIASLIYLFNPTAGFFELLPDNIPFIGNLDEAAATGILIMVLRYFGLDLTRPRTEKNVTPPKK